VAQQTNDVEAVRALAQGYRNIRAEIAKVVPPELQAGPGTDNRIPLRRTALHLLTTVEADVSSSGIRRRAAEAKSLAGLVPDAVADYIQKQGLYLHEHEAK